MTNFLASLSSFATTIISTLGYPGLVAIMVLENVFPPIPSEVVLPFAGYLSSLGRFNFWLVVLAGMIGSVGGAEILYALGFYGNERVVKRLIRKFGRWVLITEDDLGKAERWFKKHGPKAVFTARLIPVVRSLISVPAGIAKMPQGSFLFYTALGTTLWSFILASLGKILGENWEVISIWVKNYEHVTLLVLAIIFAYLLYSKLSNYLKSQNSNVKTKC